MGVSLALLWVGWLSFPWLHRCSTCFYARVNSLTDSHNKREKARQAKLIVEMRGKTTVLQDLDNSDQEGRTFNYDYSYWSHDGFTEEPNGYLAPATAGSNYADQKCVFDDLGRGVLKNAWEGYNCSLFAYGQTGSGKSWSVVGYGQNKGIVPLFCEELFTEIEKRKADEAGSNAAGEYQVAFSMLEIYNERVRDLLNSKANKKTGLKVRQHPKKGFYVPELLQTPVASYKEIENRMNEGTQNRTVAATNMNQTSSRAHTIVKIDFVQKVVNKDGTNMTKTSSINLVDLAGSERADSTGATGERLKEGAAINQSLSALGNVIAALADDKPGTIVPYRDSVLTKLLKNALGGNSKTIMIAAISPADINYEETLSTLRYADRAKQIKTKAVVNETPTEKLIRELKEENSRLMELLKQNGGAVMTVGAADTQTETAEMNDEEAEELKAQMEENKKEMDEMKRTWEEKLQAAQEALQEKDLAEELREKERLSTPHLYNLNVDPQLTGKVVYVTKNGQHTIGNRNTEPAPDILLIGPNIRKDHAVVVNDNGGVLLKVCQGACVRLNGELIPSEADIHHNDRIQFGANHLYIFYHPAELEAAKLAGMPIREVTYDDAQEEIARFSGLNMTDDGSGSSKMSQLLKEDLMDIIPMVNEANAVSEELDRKVQFEVVVLPAAALGRKGDQSEVWVLMNSLINDLRWLWSKNKFINRKYLMAEMYENFVSTQGEDWILPDERDPFTEAADAEILIGATGVYLKNLAFLVDLKEQVPLLSYGGKKAGVIQFELIPCRSDGKEICDDDEDLFVDDSDELIGRDVYFQIRIPSCRGLIGGPYQSVWCRYKFYLDSQATETERIGGTINPDFSHVDSRSVLTTTKQFVKYLESQFLRIEVWGIYAEAKVNAAKPTGSKTATRDLLKAKQEAKLAESNFTLVRSTLDKESGNENQNQVLLQQKTTKRKNDMYQKKIIQLQQFLAEAEKMGKTSIEISELLHLLHGTSYRPTAAAVNSQPSSGQDRKDPPPAQPPPCRNSRSTACKLM
eukprot:m.105220 g.105220  ORF g.105220 m.105220 type:complete len:1030 (+) comp37217_c0_seq30:391-3480(+)